MSSNSSFLLFLVCASAALGAETAESTPPPAAAPPTASTEKVEHLDAFVVSAGADPKTSFDLAQGTSVLAGTDLRKLAQATLGETLANTPGVSSTYYGPGASRPIIRGLGGDRIRVLDNGVGALDASNVSPDHGTAIEPLFASRIEVLRGPSTLLYGSSAVGGVVNVIDNTIPETPADGDAHGNLELRAGGAGRERGAVLSVGGGDKNFAVHVNALKQRTRDLEIPGVPRIDPDAPANQVSGTLPDSASDTFTVGGGGTVFWSTGRLGAGITHYETNYGVPTDEVGTSIRMNQTRYDFAGEVTQPFGPFLRAKARVGYGDYRHAEVSDGTTVNTIFTNRAWEGRLELPHVAVGNLTGTLGLQGSRSDFAAVGEEVATPPSLTQNAALFAVEELKLGEKTTLQFGGRIEGQSIRLGDVDPAAPALPGYNVRAGEKRKTSGTSASTGLVFYPAKDWSIGLSIAYTERLPTAQELFSNGPHGGTAAYEIGTTSLSNEKSLGFDLSVRRRAGFITASLGLFVNRFRNYIFEQELPAGSIPAANNPDGLTPYQFAARDADFRGAEGEVSFHFIDQSTRHLHLDLTSDYVRARQVGNDQPLPRMPPLRFGAMLSYDDARWGVDARIRHAARQDQTSPDETETPGYTLFDAGLTFQIPTHRVKYELFARGTNLANATAREHTSFLKEFAPLPGRGVLFGVRATF